MSNANTVNAANESRFNAAHYSEALTAFSVGWKDERLQEIVDYVAPSVPVGRRFEYRVSDNAESFYQEDDDIRAIGSEFKRVEYSGKTVNSKTENKGLTIRVDHDEVCGDDWQERYTQLLLQRLLRNELVRVESALSNSVEYSESIIWEEENVNADAMFRKVIQTIATKSGVRPNRMLIAEDLWNDRMKSMESQNNAMAFKASSMTPDELAASLLLDSCKVSSSRYQTPTAGKRVCFACCAYFFYASDAICKDEPSNFKRFYTPMEDGSPFRVYCEEHAKYTDITVEHYSTIAQTCSVGIGAIV